MKTLSIHARLRASTFALLLVIPLVTLEVWIISRQPYWRFPLRPAEIWTAAVALIILPLLFWINQLRRWALCLASIFLVSWIVVTGWFAIHLKFPNLGFFAVGLILFFSIILSWIYSEMSRSFLNPHIRWYETIPKPIPGLQCRVQGGEKPLYFQVGRLDMDGTFVVDFKQRELIAAASKVSVQFQFKDSTIELQGTVRKVLKQATGMGIQFEVLAPDLHKEMGDFIEKLRGEGYV